MKKKELIDKIKQWIEDKRPDPIQYYGKYEQAIDDMLDELENIINESTKK